VRIVKRTDIGRRGDAGSAGVAGDLPVDDTLELPLLRGERLAGRVLTRLVVSAGLLSGLTALAAAGLAWAGAWEPLVAVSVMVLLAAVAWRLSALVPTRALPVWVALTLVVMSIAASAWAGMTHDEQMLPRGEAGVNAQAATSLAQRHQWPIPVSAKERADPAIWQVPGVSLASQGFRQVGSAAAPALEPMALIGAPAWFSVGVWVGGVTGMFWVPAVFGGLLVLSIGLLTSSVVGPRWGPLAALGTAICFPVLHAARATSADVLAAFVICSGLLPLVAATRAGERGRPQQARAAGLVAGALVASGAFFRPDAFAQIALLLPFAALLVIRGNGAGASILWGAGGATALAALTGAGLSMGLVQEQRGALTPLGLLVAGCAVLAWLMIASARRGAGVPRRARAMMPASAAALAVGGSLALLALPTRQGLVWTSWWTGPYALVVAAVVVAVSAAKVTGAVLRGERLPGWVGALAVGLGAAAVHWRTPSVGQEAPWVGGELVLAVPLLIVSVALAAAWSTRWSTRRLPAVAAVVASVGTASLLLVPEAAATWPHAHDRLSQGQVAAVGRVCRELRPADVVLMTDDRAVQEWLPTVRATCGVTALALDAPTRRDPVRRASAVADVARAVNATSAKPRRLVVMAAGSAAGVAGPAGPAVAAGVPVAPVSPVAVVNERMTQDQVPVTVTGRPDGLSSFPLQVWLAEVGRR
jgi:hypothetical protein